jgi:hypothetical protein
LEAEGLVRFDFLEEEKLRVKVSSRYTAGLIARSRLESMRSSPVGKIREI